MASNQLSLNQVIQYFIQLAANLKRVHSFGYGPIEDLGRDGTSPVYPLLWVEPITSTLRKDSVVLRHKLHVVDLVDKELANEQDVLSDSLRTCLEIKSFIFKDFFYDIFPSDESELEPVFYRYDDDLFGYIMTLELQMDWLADVCNIPGLYPSGVTYSSGPSYYNVVLQDYLPLAGGALYGPLTGTTAIFNSITGGTIYSGSTNLNDIFLSIHALITGSTFLPTQEVGFGSATSGITSDSQFYYTKPTATLTVPTVSAQTYYSGSTLLSQVIQNQITGVTSGLTTFLPTQEVGFGSSISGLTGSSSFSYDGTNLFLFGELRLGNNSSASIRWNKTSGSLLFADNSGTGLLPASGNLVYMADRAHGNTTVFQFICDSTAAYGMGVGLSSVPTARVHIVGSNSSVASLRINSGSTVVAVNDGDIWNDGTNLVGSIGGVEKRLDNASIIPGTNIVTAATVNGDVIVSTISNLINGSGLATFIPVFTSGNTIADSIIQQINGNTNLQVNGGIDIVGDLNVLGTATTFHTQTVSTTNNVIQLNLSGNHLTAINGGIVVLSGQPTGGGSSWTVDSNGNWSANTIVQASGLTVTSGGHILSGGTDLYNIFSSAGNVNLNSTQVGFGSASNILTSSSNLIFLDASSGLGLGITPQLGGNAGIHINSNNNPTIKAETSNTNNQATFFTANVPDNVFVQFDSFGRGVGGVIAGNARAGMASIRLYPNASVGMIDVEGLYPLVFGTNGIERYRITEVGDLVGAGGISGTTVSASTVDVFGNINIRKDINANIGINITNEQAGNSSQTSLTMTNDTGAQFQVSKTSSSITPYKNILSSDGYLYNYQSGNIAILNDNPSGNINFAAGGSSVAQLTLTSAGNLIANHISATTLSGGTITSGSTNLYQIFATTGSTFVQPAALAFGSAASGITSDTNFTFNTNIVSLAVSEANSNVGFYAKNTNSGAGLAEFRVINDTGDLGQLFKTCTNYVTYKTISKLDYGLYNQSAGNITLINDWSGGQIFLTAGGHLTPDLIVDQNSLVWARHLSANTFSASTIASGSTDLYQIFQTIGGTNTPTTLQPGLNTYTGGTATSPTVNISAATLSSISATTVSGGTIYSGSTEIGSLFDTLYAPISVVATQVQPGRNTLTGGTQRFPVINTVVSPGFLDVAISGHSSLNVVSAGSINSTFYSGTSISANTVSGGTITSGATNLYTIFARPELTVANVNAGTNIRTGGTATSPTISVINDPIFNSISAVTSLSANSIVFGSLTNNTNGLSVITGGTRDTAGRAIMAGGTATISTSKITSKSYVFLTPNTSQLANIGFVYENYTSRNPGASFQINSSNILDTSEVAWMIMEPI